MEDKIKVSQDVFDGINMVRETGVTNMFDTRVVLHILKVTGYTEAFDWITDHKDDYVQGLMRGFEAS